MAGVPPTNDRDFGTREEDWPDIDVDSDTEEGAEAVRRAEAAFNTSFAHSRRRQQQQTVADGAITDALYLKAKDRQDQLTDAERRLLLSRGDVIGKALADPAAITADEMHEVLLWPPPEVVRANIQRATGGTLRTPSDLHAKAKDAIARGQFDTMINADEAALLSRSFHALGDPSFNPAVIMAALGSPGHRHAFTLLSNRLGLDPTVVMAAAARASVRRPFPSATPTEQHPTFAFPPHTAPQPGPFLSQGPSPTDLFGAGPWPDTHPPVGALDLFSNEAPASLSGFAVHQPGWSSLPESHKDAYRARAEAARRAAWAEFEAALTHTPPAVRLQNFMWSRQALLPPHVLTRVVTGFELFRQDVGAAEAGQVPVEYWEVVRRWEGLSAEQRRGYDERALVTHREAVAALPRDYMANLLRERVG